MNTVLFDLDGTLLPMDQDRFVETYLGELSMKGATLGYGAEKLVGIVLSGVEAMVANDGTMTNAERFWSIFVEAFGGEYGEHVKRFELFYQNEFARVAKVVEPTPLADQAVQLLKHKGYQLVLATNPIFPRIATVERMRWAGLNPKDFDLITTYENCRFSKPNLNYYRQILGAVGVDPHQCLMVGNDVLEDIAAAQLGLGVFLVTDDLINSGDEDISTLLQGDRFELLDYLHTLPVIGGV